MKIVRASEQRAMPWKNGGGITYEVAVFPAISPSLDDFDWRVSMARVAADGPFSLFPGIDRSLAIVERRRDHTAHRRPRRCGDRACLATGLLCR